MTRLALDSRAGILFVAAHTRTKNTSPKVGFFEVLCIKCMMQGSIYIYAMDGTPLVTGKPARAMAINSKIGIVTGLTLDPIKKVIKFDLNIAPSSLTLIC